jgi:predicted Zn-dependent protease
MMHTGPHTWGCCLLALLVLAATTGWGEAPQLSTPVTEPRDDCYRAATEGARDAYPCDLAVQIARDGGDSRELAAALANRAMVLVHARRLDAALEDLNAAVQAAPESADLHGNRGNLLLRMNRAAEALAAHQRAVALAPDDPAVYYNRAFSHLALGDSARAAADVESARVLLTGAPGGPGRPVTVR